MTPIESEVQTATYARSTVVEGSDNKVLSFGNVSGGVYYTQHFNQAKAQAAAVAQGQFFAPMLSGYDSRRWVDPPKSHELVRLLAEHRLLFLGGGLDEKKDCAYHLACSLCESLERREVKDLEVLERCAGRDPQKIETALDAEKPKILLLPEVTPRQLIGQTPAKLRALLKAHQSYAILTTDTSREDWGIATGSLEALLWHDLSWEGYYGSSLLGNFLHKLLLDSPKGLPATLWPKENELIEGVSLNTVINKLQTPGKVRDFSTWLLSGEVLTREKIDKQLARLAGDVPGVTQWYCQFDSRQQLLVLGLALFDGLPDDMLFTGLELLVNEIWRSSDPAIPQFDYADLVQCTAYFKKVETRRGGTRIVCTSQDRREQILKVGWEHQRRRLLAALPVLREMIRISVSVAEPANAVVSVPAPASPSLDSAVARHQTARRTLNRSEEDTLQLHQVLVESLGLISQLSTQVVEQHFLELAADSSDKVQQLVARALSTWRDNGLEEKLLDLLRRWWKQACEIWDTDSHVARLGQRGEDPFAAVRSAVALTVGFAARFDRENQMSSALLDLLLRTLEDRHPRVRRASAEALKYAVAWHFRQLEPLLRARLFESDDFLAAIALGAAEACVLRTEETVAILDNWRAIARAEKRLSSPERVTKRERLLATVALTYGAIRPQRGEWPLDPEILCANLRSILMEEIHPFVRHYAFFAIERQALQHFEMVVQLLQDLLSHIQIQDRPAVIEIFVKTYLHQRYHLRGSEHKALVDERSYDVWIGSPRPLTEIEATLYGWLLDASRPIVQQLAVDVFDQLGRTSLEMAERRMRATRPLVPAGALPAGEGFDRRPQPQVRPLPWLGYLAVFCVASRKPQVRATLQPLLAEVISLQKLRLAQPNRPPASPQTPPPPVETPRPPADVLVERWSAISNDATRAIAHLLGRAFLLYRWRWGLISACFLTVLTIYKGAPILYHRIQESRTTMAQSTSTATSPSPAPARPQDPSNP
jgi:hypothetical protein